MPLLSSLRFALIAVVASLPGCVRYVERPLEANASAAGFTGRSLIDAGLRSFLAGQRAGRGSWNVERLALAAAYFHGDVALARAAAEEAAAGVATAGQRPNPVLSFSPGYNATTTGISPWIVSPSIDVTIETAGKRGHRVATARAAAEAAQLRVVDAAWTARAKVRAALLDHYSAEENGAQFAAEVALHEEALKRLDAQVKAGESPAFELNQARLALNRSKLLQHDADRVSATSRAQLAAAIGVPASALAGVTFDFSDFRGLPAVPGASARRRALTHRADLLAALADYAAAEADLRLEVARQYPDLKLSPGYSLDQNENKWSLGFVVELPILNQNRGPIAQAEARRKTAAVKFEARQAAIFGEIDIALAAYRAARAKADTAATLAEGAAHASDTTQRMVDAGEIAPLELTRRRIEASAAKLSRLEARLQAQQAIGALEAALQVPLRSIR